jgi:hypothetical protein
MHADATADFWLATPAQFARRFVQRVTACSRIRSRSLVTRVAEPWNVRHCRPLAPAQASMKLFER